VLASVDWPGIESWVGYEAADFPSFVGDAAAIAKALRMPQATKTPPGARHRVILVIFDKFETLFECHSPGEAGMSEEISRRTVFKKIVVAVGGATVVLALPERWLKPVIESIVTPANAGFSAVFVSPPTTPPPSGG
jgi:hypothetical protein